MTPIDHVEASDTRKWPRVPIEGEHRYGFKIAQVPADATALDITFTATGAVASGHLRAAAPGKLVVNEDGTGTPSCLNFAPGADVCNTVTVKCVDRQVDLFLSAPTHLVAAVTGFYT